jgi:DNA-directed RNA polymerase specialized sigma24 family protein
MFCVGKPSDPEEWKEKLMLARNGDLLAERAVFEASMRLGRAIARRRRWPLDECEIESLINLATALAMAAFKTGSYPALFARVLTNLVIDTFRRASKEALKEEWRLVFIDADENGTSGRGPGMELRSVTPDPERTLLLKEQEEQINLLLARLLSTNEFRAFALHRKGYANSKIDRVMGMSAVHLIHHAKKKIRRALEDGGDGSMTNCRP